MGHYSESFLLPIRCPNAGGVGAEDTAALTIRSADLSGDTITGVYIVIKATNGTTLIEGHAPLTFTGTVGSTYTVTVPVLGNVDFEKWDNGLTDRTRTIVLGQDDTTITAYLEVDVPTVNATIDSREILIQRFADIVDQDNCFDTDDARRLNMVINSVIRNIFSESEGGSNHLQQEINRLVQNCQVVDAGADELNQGNASNTTGPTEPSSDESSGDESDEPSSDESSGDEDEEEE